MAKKVVLPYESFKRMIGGTGSVKLIDFLTVQRIGKVEFTSKPWSWDSKLKDLPAQYKDKYGGDKITKWVVDLENGKFLKLVNGEVDHQEKISVGQAIGEVGDLIENEKTNDYSSVTVYRRTSIPGKTAGKFSNESKRNSIKLVESIIRKILSESEQKWVRFDSHRSRDKAERILGSLPKAKASFRHNGHYYPLDDDQISKLSSIKSGVKIANKLPGDPDDWMNAR